jgi:hypothetical protein
LGLWRCDGGFGWDVDGVVGMNGAELEG